MFKCLNAKMNKGFTIIELIVAIFLITTGIVGISFLVTHTISSIPYLKNKLIALYLAQEGIEIIRNIRDTNWIEGDPWDADLACCGTLPCDCEADYTTHSLTDTYDGDFLYIDIDDIDGDGVTNVYKYIDTPGPNDIQTKFKRKITIGGGPIEESMNIKAEVFWEEKGKQYKVEVQENLYNWK